MFIKSDILEIIKLAERLERSVKIVEHRYSGDYEHRISYNGYNITEDDVYYIYTDNVKEWCPIERIIQVILE